MVRVTEDTQKQFAERVESFKEAWRVLLNMSERFPHVFKFRFECGEAQATITRDSLERGELRVDQLVLALSDEEPSNSLVVLESLSAERNAMLQRLLPDKERTAANSVRADKLGRDSLRLTEEVERLVRDFGMSHPQFSRQSQPLFDCRQIDERLAATLRKDFHYLDWRRQDAPLFEYFDEIGDWDDRLAAFGPAASQDKPTVQAARQLRKILKGGVDQRMRVLIACAFFLRREWQQEDYQAKVKTLLEDSGLPRRALFADVLKMRLGFLLSVFERVEESLGRHFFQGRLEKSYRVDMAEEEREEVEDWMGEFEEENDLRQLGREIVRLVSRHHRIFRGDHAEMGLSAFLKLSPRAEQFDKLDSRYQIYRFWESQSLKVKHLYAVFEICEELLRE